MVVGALAAQFRSLLLYRQAADSRGSQDIVQTLGWNPYRVRAVGQLAGRFQAAELQQAIERLSKLDLQLKSDAISPQVLLSMFVVKTAKLN
jgi:DNA polymerase III delta subunit